ncbi:MAG: hypothetical protein KJ041_10115, partial [Gammaproteobacteria bacterium]|nr:hypothetical protein [Gammaproteobacteria bacterium]
MFSGIAEQIAIVAAGLFFLVGLLTGVWKYSQIRRSPRARAHYYVDIAHRTSLMYSFAALLIAVFAVISDLPMVVEACAVIAQVVYFGMAITSYVVHGFLGDTANQLQVPHKLGHYHVPAGLMTLFMGSLVVAEIGGFV